MRRTRAVVGSLLVAGAVVLAACSSGGDGSARSSSRAGDEAAATATTPLPASDSNADSTALCAIFDQLAANGAGRDAQFNATTPEGWDQRIATTAKMVEVAPPEWRDEAETYHQMMLDRAQLAAEHGYVGVNDLPADVRAAFISSHVAMQAKVNELIASMRRECGARPSG